MPISTTLQPAEIKPLLSAISKPDPESLTSLPRITGLFSPAGNKLANACPSLQAKTSLIS